MDHVKRAKLCINCLRLGPMVKEYRSRSCKVCKARHNTPLHMHSTDAIATTQNGDGAPQESVSMSSHNETNGSQVILSTMFVSILDKNNKFTQHVLCIECSSELPLISDIIKNQFYVDDMLTVGNSVEEVIFIANEVSWILKSGVSHCANGCPTALKYCKAYPQRMI
ncbi:hypothetical protein NQ318_017258 [Aromia moschata]|uniref:Uncharacterized protein n=1 Tax=Aromia moschata TaxID=1265417 RepID=A0AAV8YNX5_9CUCU|nr:hypothetical protein NQ318_017258 [Aromia moschata]